MADATVLNIVGGNPVRVRIPPPAPPSTRYGVSGILVGCRTPDASVSSGAAAGEGTGVDGVASSSEVSVARVGVVGAVGGANVAVDSSVGIARSTGTAARELSDSPARHHGDDQCRECDDGHPTSHTWTCPHSFDDRVLRRAAWILRRICRRPIPLVIVVPHPVLRSLLVQHDSKEPHVALLQGLGRVPERISSGLP